MPDAEANAPRGDKDPAGQPDSVPAAWTFDQTISATLTADPKIRAGFEAITQANADLLTSSLFPNPSLLIDGIFLPLRAFTPDRPGGPPQMDAQVSYPIDWFVFGKRAAAMASATQGVRQTEAGYADLIRLRVLSTSQAFYDLLEAKALLTLARLDVDNLTKLEAAIKRAADVGGKALVDLNRVRLDLLKSQQALREAESAVVVAKAKLRALLNRTDPDPTFDVSGNLDAPLSAEPASVEEAFAQAQENRPDIQSLRLQISKAEADIVVERRKAFPQVTPMVGYSRQFQQEALAAPDAPSMTVSVTTTLPLFDRNQGNRLKASSIAAQNGLNLRAGLVDLRAEVEQTVQEFRTASAKARAVAQDQLKVAENILTTITQAYEKGGRPLIEVLDAQRNYRDTYRLYINSRADYWRSLYKYSAVLGKQVQP
jgi:cobalt-zinc-cadmium efflux system outer membrane protein